MRDSDLLADLPPPDDFEPPSLRDDIRDELQDHLQCAFRREVLRDGDEPAAQARVLNRFGDPKQLARRLWWQAMWSRVMGKKLLAGLQWAVTLAAVFCAGAVYVTNARILGELESARTEDRRSTASLAHELQELRQQIASAQDQGGRNAADRQSGPREGGSGTPGDAEGATAPRDSAATKTSLKVALVYDREGRPPVTDAVKEIALVSGDKRYAGLPEDVASKEPFRSENGRFVFAAPAEDRYDLVITLADERTSTRKVVIRDTQPREMTVVCPELRKKVLVLITRSPLPEDLQNMCGVNIRLRQSPDALVEDVIWLMPWCDQEVVFDWMGQATKCSLVVPGMGIAGSDARWGPVSEFDLGSASEDDRRIGLMSGPIEIDWMPEFKSAGKSTSEAEKLVPLPPLRRTVNPGEDHWELDVPEELIAGMRKVLAARKGAGD
jgi:hypothetical protein